MTNSIFWRVKRFFCDKYSHVLGIDIGKYAVKMVELDLRGNVPLLTNYATEDLLPVPVDNAEFIVSRADVINRLMQIHGVLARHVFVSVEDSSSYTRQVEFPRLAGKELAEAVRWEIERYVPYETDSYYHDFSVLESTEGEALRVFLAAAPKLYIDVLTTVFAKTPLHILAIEGEHIAIGRLVRMKAHAMVLVIGADSSGVIFYRSGVPGPAHKISFGFIHLFAAQEGAHEAQNSGVGQIIEAFSEEVAHAIEYYDRQYSSVISNLYVCGGGCQCICERLQHLPKLSVEPISASQDCCILSSSLDAGYTREYMPQLAVAVGLALRGVRQ